ncbi:hypothetical protein L6164_021117 [Bauhinia variegata]|uniref:Uncharacterized protein n=1 Tax=Bauhinia variegata TaxID=167791 RepID=A0ACB9MYT2_BAUVA|nr:hypothetical protein L6164_021117 [Bauhinia variegata]
MRKNIKTQLAVAVRSIQWSYGIFWSYSTTKGALEWGDGYYNGDIKTRKTVQSMGLKADKIVLQRSEQLRELYKFLLEGETDPQAKRPSAALSPEDLTNLEWYYLVCMCYESGPNESLPGRALESGETVWLCNVQHADSRVFSRSLLAKTVACFPCLGGVIEIGTTELVSEDLSLVQHVKACFLNFSKPTCYYKSSSALNKSDDDKDPRRTKVENGISCRMALGNDGCVHPHCQVEDSMLEGINGAQDSLASGDCISDALKNQHEEHKNVSQILFRELQDCNHSKLSSLNSGHDEDLNYTRTLSSLLLGNSSMSKGSYTSDCGYRSSFTRWKRGRISEWPRPKMSENILFTVPRMHSSFFSPMSLEEDEKIELPSKLGNDYNCIGNVLSDKRRENKNFQVLKSMVSSINEISDNSNNRKRKAFDIDESDTESNRIAPKEGAPLDVKVNMKEEELWLLASKVFKEGGDKGTNAWEGTVSNGVQLTTLQIQIWEIKGLSDLTIDSGAKMDISSSFEESLDQSANETPGYASDPSPSRWSNVRPAANLAVLSRLGMKQRQQNSDDKLDDIELIAAELEMMKERFAKLLLGEDMSGGGKGVCTAVTISNSITNLYATVFGQNLKLEPLKPEKKAMWKREMACLLSVCDYIVEFAPTKQSLQDGTIVEMMASRPRTDIYINLPALQKLDTMLLEILDSFEDSEFWYAEQGSISGNSGRSRASSFRRIFQRKDEKWWLPVPCVLPGGLSEKSRKHLREKRDCANQIHKAAMAINSSILSEMDIPETYIASLPKSGRASLGDTIYRYMHTASKFSPAYLLDCLNISSEHEALEIADKVEASMFTWRRKACLSHSKSSWNKVKEHMSETERSDKNYILAERAESMLFSLKQRYPELSQTTLDTCKIQFNRDVGKATLESYSRVLEGLAFNIVAWIEDVLSTDNLMKNREV